MSADCISFISAVQPVTYLYNTLHFYHKILLDTPVIKKQLVQRILGVSLYLPLMLVCPAISVSYLVLSICLVLVSVFVMALVFIFSIVLVFGISIGLWCLVLIFSLPVPPLSLSLLTPCPSSHIPSLPSGFTREGGGEGDRTMGVSLWDEMGKRVKGGSQRMVLVREGKRNIGIMKRVV